MDNSRSRGANEVILKAVDKKHYQKYKFYV